MAQRSHNGLTVIVCDHSGCSERFHSYSVESIVREQARIHAKWSLVEGKKTKHGKQPDQDFCRNHRPRPRMSESHPEVAQKWDAAASRARSR